MAFNYFAVSLVEKHLNNTLVISISYLIFINCASISFSINNILVWRASPKDYSFSRCLSALRITHSLSFNTTHFIDSHSLSLSLSL
jgi:hypothetical protein